MSNSSDWEDWEPCKKCHIVVDVFRIDKKDKDYYQVWACPVCGELNQIYEDA